MKSGIFFGAVASCAAALLLVGCKDAPICSWSESERGIIAGGDSPVMRVLTIADPEDSLVLRRECADFSAADLSDALYALLASRMVATVTSPEQDGVGIAGPQVGILRRVVAVQRFDKEGEPFEVYPNIRIIETRGELVAGPEGCLSVPNRREEVLRSRDITISYSSPLTLADTTEVVTGFTAVIFQHECDHLDGRLYIDLVD